MKRIQIIIYSCILSIAMNAQNISVSDFHLDEMDLTANQQGTIVLDQNGEKCALIKVKTTQTGFIFDAGSLGVTKTEQKTAQIWVYVPHGVRKLNVSHQKYGTLDYQLPVTTQKAKTYIMDLKAETPLPVNSQRLTIKCQPKNAVVMIDGEAIDIANGTAELTLKLGTHKYVAMANGYYQSDGTINLVAGRPGKLTIELDTKESNQSVKEDTSNGFMSAEINQLGNESIDNLVIAIEKSLKLGVANLPDSAYIGLGTTPYEVVKHILPGKEYYDKSNGSFRWNAKNNITYYTDQTKDKVTLIAVQGKKVIKNIAFPAMCSGLSWSSSCDEWSSWAQSVGAKPQNSSGSYSSLALAGKRYILILGFMGKSDKKDALYLINMYNILSMKSSNK